MGAFLAPHSSAKAPPIPHSTPETADLLGEDLQQVCAGRALGGGTCWYRFPGGLGRDGSGGPVSHPQALGHGSPRGGSMDNGWLMLREKGWGLPP